MQPRGVEKPNVQGLSSPDGLDVQALLTQLEQEVRLLGSRYGALDGVSAERLSARAAADRLWPVSADRHLGGRGGAAGAAMKPVKLVVRALSRAHVEPAFTDQRVVNEALLRLVDDLQTKVDTLRAELDADAPEDPTP